MIFYRKRRTWQTVLGCLLATLLICGAALLLRRTAADYRTRRGGVPDNTAAAHMGSGGIGTVVLDAGHGGFDGGAQSADGLSEKDVNLAVSLYLRDWLEAAGVPVVMTRTDDRLLSDTPSPPPGRKKTADLNARLHIAQAVPDSLFVSIHMNSFPQTSVRGLQVWYAPADPRSMTAASALQAQSVLLQPDNTRSIKAAGSSIFLLDRLKTPGILAECGFMTNPEEAALLASDTYRKQLAFVLFLGIMQGMQAEAA